MKISEITIKSGKKIILASMTYDEELDLAESVTQALSKPWVVSNFRKTAERLYHIGSSGLSPQGHELQEYLDSRDEWERNLEEVGRLEDSPLDPKFTHDNSSMRAPTSNRGGETSNEWRTQWYSEQRRLAWREAWFNNKNELCRYSDRYRVFPGDPTDELELHEIAQLQPFFEAVRASQKTYKCSLDQAMREVMDRLPHAELTLDDLHEIISDYP